MSKVKAVTKKEQQATENNYILAFNELTHKQIIQSYGSTKISAKDKKDLKVLYENFKEKTVALNTLYAHMLYHKGQQIFKKTDLELIILYSEQLEDYQQIYYAYGVKVSQEEKKITYDIHVVNEVANEILSNLGEDLESVILELEVKSKLEKMALTSDMSFEEFLSFFDLTYPIEFKLEFDYSEFEDNKE